MPDPKTSRIRLFSGSHVLSAGAPTDPTNSELRKGEFILWHLAAGGESGESLERLVDVRGSKATCLSFSSPVSSQQSAVNE
jgi:hypothetical protein